MKKYWVIKLYVVSEEYSELGERLSENSMATKISYSRLLTPEELKQIVFKLKLPLKIILNLINKIGEPKIEETT